MLIAEEDAFDPEEIHELYASVGWTAYTADLARLHRALSASHLVVTARDTSGRLLGLARTVSDDETICYVQDLLVRPDAHRRGIGSALMGHLTRRYAHCAALLLTTDHPTTPDGERSHAFYRALGLLPYDEIRLAGFARPPRAPEPEL